MHRTNTAERAIRTFKNHFIAGLCSIHDEFPMHEWDRLLEQGDISLLLLRNARVNPKLSSYAYLVGNYDFNACPMAPPGTLLAAHLKPSKGASWSPHAVKAWYVGPALEHYRNFTCFVPQTNSIITTDTVKIFPHHNIFPEISQQDYLQQAILDILTILQTQQKTNLPTNSFGDTQSEALIQIANILGRAKEKPTPISIIPVLRGIDPPAQAAHISKIPRVNDSPVVVPSPRVQRDTNSFRSKAAKHKAAMEFFKLKVNHIFDDKGKKETIDSLRKKIPEIWNRALSNQWGRLAQGNKYEVVATNTIVFISAKELPSDATVTYAAFVCDNRPLKDEPWRVRIVVGGDVLTYAEDAASPTTAMMETKILINSVISDASEGARFISLDLKDFYLASPMLTPEYMKVHISKFPDDIIEKYNLKDIVTHDGFIFIKIQKGMYGLRQAAILAYEQLVKFLSITQKNIQLDFGHTQNYPQNFAYALMTLESSITIKMILNI